MISRESTAVPRSLLATICPFNLALQQGMRTVAAREPLWKTLGWGADQMRLNIQITKGQPCATGPMLLIVNDPSPLLGFIIISRVPREDAYFIGTPGWRKMGGILAERCIPVFTVGDFRRYPKEAFRAHVIYRFRDGVTPRTAGRTNVASLRKASDVVTKGGALLVAPAGGTMGKSDNWKSGIGHIIDKIGDVGAQVVLARIDGTSPPDAARMFLNSAFFPKLRKPLDIKLQFSEPYPISAFRKPGMSAKDISSLVREEYVKQYGSL